MASDLKKALEYEMSLSAGDIRSHAWYHGNISRATCHELLKNDGDFLVRDSTSRAGDFVLSVRCNSTDLHFVINKVVLQPHTVYERIQFTFEEDAFDTVADLITFYVGNKRCISLASRATISTPINRLTPLNAYNDTPPPKPSRIAFKPIQTNDCIVEDRPLFKMPEMNQSLIDPINYQTFLLPKDNKPLDSIVKIHSVLVDSGARILANHLTKSDLDFIKHLDKKDFGVGVFSALELILLPQGEQMREDLLDRHECLKYFVAISIVTATDINVRCQIINKWIQVALETKTALGDLFGFGAIMEGLSLISHLVNTWLMLRRDYTQVAITYETKLKPQLKSMYECNEPQAPNTTFPFIVTLVQILQRHSKSCQDTLCQNELLSLNFPWEQTSTDYGLQLINNHLEEARHMTDNLATFRRNGQIVLEGCHFEDLLYDFFSTEFHRRFLCGSRGCNVEGEERFRKLDLVVTALARKCQPDMQLD